MQKLIRDIFERVNADIPNLKETEKEIDEEIEQIISNMQDKIPQEYYNEIDRYIFEAAGVAERKGFELGVQYMAKLLFACLYH